MSPTTPDAPSPPFAIEPVLVVALGGNALVRPGDAQGGDAQAARIAEVADGLAGLDAPGGLVLTHGNGPQVGEHLLRSDLVRDQVPPTRLDTAVAATQGEIGWELQLGLRNALRTRQDPRRVATVVTQVLVRGDDPAFQNPTKFVGRFYARPQAELRAAELGWQVRPDADRGWRRVVPSPRPHEVLELPEIQALLATGTIVIACGGGGIPVIRLPDGAVAGVEAVVDKDRASALLAARLGARTLVILTGVEHVWIRFGTPSAQRLDRTSDRAVRAHAAAGEFPPGSMGPKIEAALAFLDAGGQRVIITTPECVLAGLAGQTGTHIHRSEVA